MTNRAIEKDGVLYFKCRRCGEIKPLNSAYFHRNTTAMMGYNSKCIECVREEMNTIYKPKKRYITKAELEKDLDYYKRKSEWFSKIIAKYQEENKKLKEELSIYDREYFDEDKKYKNQLENGQSKYKSDLFK